MSGTAGVANTFANAVTATGAQLDANYTTIVAYLNDPTNRNNYAADGAATNTVSLTFSPPVAVGYTAGLDLCWKWGVTNTGAVVINANGLGNISVVNPDGSQLAAGQGKAGSIGKAVYDGTRAIYIAASAQRPQEVKAWAQFNGTTTGTIIPNQSFGISTIVRGGVGTYTIVFTSAFTTTAYPMIGMSTQAFQIPANRGTGTCALWVFNSAAVAADSTDINVSFFGPQ